MANLNVLQLTIFVFMLLTICKLEGALVTNSRKLDETTPPNLENKCGGCPCNNPCNPPPSLPPPPPPSPPPPAKKTPPSNYCPPPPNGGGGSQYPQNGGQYPQNAPLIYMNGPPGNLYPVDAYYSRSAPRISSGLLRLSVTIIFVLLAIFMW